MAHKKGVGSSRNGRDSNPQYRGIKKFGGEQVVAGNIIVRQCGTKWHPGRNVGLGRDYTIYALIDGVVTFEHKDKKRTKVSVYPVEAAQRHLQDQVVAVHPAPELGHEDVPVGRGDVGRVGDHGGDLAVPAGQLRGAGAGHGDPGALAVAAAAVLRLRIAP